MDYNAIRFISQYEFDKLESGENIGYLNQFKAWDGRKAVFMFPINNYYKPETYLPIIKHLQYEHHLDYDYIVYLKLPELYTHFAAYDKEIVDKVNPNTEIPFDIDEDAYDTGSVYVVPEYRVKAYNSRYVVKVEPVGNLLENKNKEAINNMPKETINLGIENEEQTEDKMTFMKMYMELVDAPNITEQVFRQVISEIDFREEVGYQYNGSDMKVGVAYLDVISDGILKVKIAKVEQGDNVGIIVPDRVAGSYTLIEDDLEKIDIINSIEGVTFEHFGFDSKDVSLLELIAMIYIETDNAAEPYKLIPEKEAELEETPEDSDIADMGLGNDAAFGGANERMFDEIEDNIEAIDDVEANLESFKRFQVTSKALAILERNIHDKIPNAIRQYIKTKAIAENKILAIEVDNAAIFETFNNIPDHARKLLTTIGEAIRTNEYTQLVDSVSKGKKRLFLVAENINNNYWTTEEDDMTLLERANKKYKVVVPGQDEVIKLKRSNVRLEARAIRPYKHGEQIAFINKFQKVK